MKTSYHLDKRFLFSSFGKNCIIAGLLDKLSIDDRLESEGCRMGVRLDFGMGHSPHF